MVATDRPSRLEIWPVVILAGVPVGIAAAIFLLWPINDHREARIELESRNNLKQFGLALHNYAADRNGRLPPGTLVDAHGATLHGWEALLLPYVDQAPLHARIDFALPWDTPENLALFRTPLRTFQDLRYAMQIDADGLPVSHYAANELVLKPGRTMRFDEITDGLSNTIVAGTAAENPRGWGTPYNLRDPRIGLNTGPDSFGCPNGRPIILFGDGSVRMVMKRLRPKPSRPSARLRAAKRSIRCPEAISAAEPLRAGLSNDGHSGRVSDDQRASLRIAEQIRKKGHWRSETVVRRLLRLPVSKIRDTRTTGRFR